MLRDRETAPGAEGVEFLIGRAAELFDRHGYDGVRMHDVAAAACVSTRTLWRRYPTKSALLRGIVSAFSRQFAAELTVLVETPGVRPVPKVKDDGLPRSADADEPLPATFLLLAAFLRFHRQHPALTRVALAARQPLWKRRDEAAAALLRGAIGHCIGARGCAEAWILQILHALHAAACRQASCDEGRTDLSCGAVDAVASGTATSTAAAAVDLIVRAAARAARHTTRP